MSNPAKVKISSFGTIANCAESCSGILFESNYIISLGLNYCYIVTLSTECKMKDIDIMCCITAYYATLLHFKLYCLNKYI